MGGEVAWREEVCRALCPVFGCVVVRGTKTSELIGGLEGVVRLGGSQRGVAWSRPPLCNFIPRPVGAMGWSGNGRSGSRPRRMGRRGAR